MPEFLIDRSLGRHIVPEKIRARGYTVRTLWSLYGDREETLADTEFLRHAGRNRWAVHTADARIRRRPHELAVVEAERVQLFALPSGGLRGVEQAQRFTDNLDRIVAACRLPGPFIYSVLPRGIQRRWP